MAIIEEWNEVLRCPICRKTGNVSLSQGEADLKPTVQLVSDGFKSVQTEYALNFHCATCNVAVEP